jgi:hypothetical protein
MVRPKMATVYVEIADLPQVVKALEAAAARIAELGAALEALAPDHPVLSGQTEESMSGLGGEPPRVPGHHELEIEDVLTWFGHCSCGRWAGPYPSRDAANHAWVAHVERGSS